MCLEDLGSLMTFGEGLAEKVNEWIEAVGETLLTEIPRLWEALNERIAEYAEGFDGVWGFSFTLMADHFREAIETMLVEGGNFGDAMKQMASGFAQSMVAAMVEIATNRLALWALEKTFLGSQKAGDVARVSGEALAGVELASINAYASTAAIPVTGPASAPAAATAARAFTQPLALAAAAAAASSLAGMAHDGIQSVPREGTWLLDRNERVLSSDQNADLIDFLNSGESLPLHAPGRHWNTLAVSGGHSACSATWTGRTFAPWKF